MKPENVSRKLRAMKGDRRRAASEQKARMRSMTAPEIFGATVYRFVFTVGYPRRETIWGRKRETPCRGTPRQISIARKAYVVGRFRIPSASRKLNFSFTTELESTWI